MVYVGGVSIDTPIRAMSDHNGEMARYGPPAWNGVMVRTIGYFRNFRRRLGLLPPPSCMPALYSYIGCRQHPFYTNANYNDPWLMAELTSLISVRSRRPYR